ncbi:MAG: ribosome-associated translation inhibitor RaiA [Cytophagaceae bacterium]|nr:ribosome-associated translation inhibitor RaiA [Cytophagaceae bacterium]
MKLQIQSIHFDADKKLLDFIQKKLDKLETFHDRITGGDVYLRLEKEEVNNKSVQIKIFIPGTSIIVKEQKSTFEEAVDVASETLKRQLKKQKEKLTER